MMIHTIVYYNKWLKRLYTKLKELTNPNLIKVPKIIVPKNKKPYYKT